MKIKWQKLNRDNSYFYYKDKNYIFNITNYSHYSFQLTRFISRKNNNKSFYLCYIFKGSIELNNKKEKLTKCIFDSKYTEKRFIK